MADRDRFVSDNVTECNAESWIYRRPVSRPRVPRLDMPPCPSYRTACQNTRFMVRLTATLTTAMLLAATPAFAHAILVDSTPAPNAHVQAGPLAITLRYNSRIDARRSKVTLTAPDGAVSRLHSAPGAAPQLLQTSADVTAGAYTLHWQVLAVDGHITRGSVPFMVDAK